MTRVENSFSDESRPSSLSKENLPNHPLIELQIENLRLQRIVAELLIRNQQLRERVQANTGPKEPQSNS
jgi:hypothetical protein